MRPIKSTIDGIILLGLYSYTDSRGDPDGCWLLHNGSQAAIVEMPPFEDGGEAPYDRALEVCRSMGLEVRYLLCTHASEDHFSKETYKGFRTTFPDATPYFHRHFARLVKDDKAIFFGDGEQVNLDLMGEPLFLVHAPKHSPSDVMTVFKGAILTGDWELETLRTVNDFGPDRVPVSLRRQSIDRLMRFGCDYHIHVVVSSRATDVRKKVDFGRLMGDTLLDRDFGWGQPVGEAKD